jgi:hypothetical protein
MLVIAHCVSSSGLGCGHWREFLYAWRHAWPAVVIGLTVALAMTVGGARYPLLLSFGLGLAFAVLVGFSVYYVSL